MPCADKYIRAEVRIAAGDRRLRVHDPGHPGRHQRVSGHPIQIYVIDDRDIARIEAGDQSLRPPVEARHPGDAG